MRVVSGDEPRGSSERYLMARNSSDLGHTSGEPCDADKLLAAAYAARGNERKSLALDVWGVLASTDMRGARGVADRLAGWLRRRSLRERGGEVLTRVVAADLVLRLLKLWHQRTCMTCQGRGSPLIPGSPVLDKSRDCGDCHGTGLIPIERMVKPEHARAARDIEREVLSLQSVVFGDMAAMLAGRMELT